MILGLSISRTSRHLIRSTILQSWSPNGLSGSVRKKLNYSLNMDISQWISNKKMVLLLPLELKLLL
jgi:hypothetical protein